MKPARFDFIYIDLMKQDICIQTNTAFVFKALLFLVGNFDITVKYCTDEQTLARRIFTHTHTLYRKKKKKKNVLYNNTKNYCKHGKEMLCQHNVIMKSQ